MNLIVAVSRNGQIGVSNELPWHIKEDLQYFKKLTTGSTVIMGRKTFESIGRPLPNRKNVVLTRDTSFTASGIEVVHSVETLLSYIKEDNNVFIIGGGEVYSLLLSYANKLYITLVDIDIDGDTAFPDYTHDFIKVHSKLGEEVSSVGYDYYFTEWVRK